MSDAIQSTIDNLGKNTGRRLDEWFTVLDGTQLAKHAELMNHLKATHGVSHGFANFIVLRYRERGSSTAADDLLAAQYAGAKAALRPIYDAVVAAASGFGPDVQVVANKSGVSLRRSKQFAVVEVPSAKRVQLGIQLKGEPTTDRLLTGNAMCSHKVNVTAAEQVDDELISWLRTAYERA